MPDIDKIFRRMAEQFVEHDISVDRITWLSGIGMDDNGVRDYLKDDVLSKDEEDLKKLFGDTIGHYLNELLKDEGGDGVECAVDELLLLDGWIVQVSYREPNPKTVKFVNGDMVSSWAPSSWITTELIYSVSLSSLASPPLFAKPSCGGIVSSVVPLEKRGVCKPSGSLTRTRPRWEARRSAMPESARKPCPFCDSAYLKVAHKTRRNGEKRFFVLCPRCGTRGPWGETVEVAEWVWNIFLRPLQWTKQPPKEPGWYWFRPVRDGGEVIVQLRFGDFTCEHKSFEGCFIRSDGTYTCGEWAGPVPEPKWEFSMQPSRCRNGQ